jgi:hydroxypyruvate isomerase
VVAAICIEMLYRQMPAEDKVRGLADLGFGAIEFWGWREKNLTALASACRSRGVRITNFSGHRRGSLIVEQEHRLVLEDLKESTRVAADLDCSRLMLLSDQLGEGGAVTRESGLAAEQKHRNLVEGIRKAREAVPETIELVLEPLNTRVDHPGYYLDSTAEAVRVIEQVGSPGVRILCDLYHMGVMGEDLEALIRRHSALIGHYHVADFPGRHQPGTGTADWPGLMALIEAADPGATVGFEYVPEGKEEDSLRAIRRTLSSAGISL